MIASSTLSRLSTFLDLLNSEQCEVTAVGVTWMTFNLRSLDQAESSHFLA